MTLPRAGSQHPHAADANPVRADCPLECLAAVLSAHAYNPLGHAASYDYPGLRTVGGVAAFYRDGRLADIRHLGPTPDR